MQKRVLQGRALLVILWVFGCFLGFFAKLAMADDDFSYFSDCLRTAKEDPYYQAQFNPRSFVRFIAVNLLKLEECEGLIIQIALYDSYYDVRGTAVAKLNSPQYVNLMWEIFWKDDSKYVRVHAMYNLVRNMNTIEKDSLQNEFINIILDEKNNFFDAVDGLNTQTNQEFLYYFVVRYVVENDGDMTTKCFRALQNINPEERIKLIEEIKNHFANLSEGTKDWLDYYQNAPE